VVVSGTIPASTQKKTNAPSTEGANDLVPWLHRDDEPRAGHVHRLGTNNAIREAQHQVSDVGFVGKESATHNEDRFAFQQVKAGHDQRLPKAIHAPTQIGAMMNRVMARKIAA